MLIDLQPKLRTTTARKPRQPVFAGDNALTEAPKAPVATARRVPVQTMKAYAPIRFAGTQGFNMTDFIRNDADSSLTRTWQKAQQLALGATVTPEDWLLAVLEEFNDDLEQFKSRGDNTESYYAHSYIGGAIGLSNNAEFLQKFDNSPRQRHIGNVLAKLKGSRPADADSEVEPGQKTASPELAQIFSAAQQVLRKAETVGQMALVSPDVVLQLMAKNPDNAGQLAKSMIQDLALRSTVDIRNYTDDDSTAASSGPVGDATEGVNLTDFIRKDGFKPFPLVRADLDDAVKRLRQNRKHLVLQLPPGLDSDRAVEAIALEADKVLPADQKPVFIRFDIGKFAQQLKPADKPVVDVEEFAVKLREKIQGWVAEHERVVVHMKTPESLLALKPDQAARLFNQIDVNGKARFILTPPPVTKLLIDPAHPEKRLPTIPDIVEPTGHFITLTAERPAVAALKTHLAGFIGSEFAKKYPGVTVQEGALEQAVLMASKSGDPVEETTLDYLMAGAEHLLENDPAGMKELGKEHVKQGVLEDPAFEYFRKANRNGSFQSLTQDDLNEMLADAPELVGLDEAEDFFKEWGVSLDHLSDIEKMGLKSRRAVLVYGNEGTGKTDLVLQFARKKKIPVMLLSGKTLSELQDPERVFAAVKHAFASARRQANKTKSPVMVVADNLEAGWIEVRQQGGPERGAVLMNPLLLSLFIEQKNLRQEENPYVLSVGITKDQRTLEVIAKTPDSFDAGVQTTPPLYLKDRVNVFKAMAASIEKKAGRKLFADNIDYSPAARTMMGATPKHIGKTLERAAREALTDKGFTEQALVDTTLLNKVIYDVEMGKEQKRFAKLIDPKDRLRTARHEVNGHALNAVVLKRILRHGGPVINKVTMIPQGGALGYVSFMNEDREVVGRRKLELFADLVCSIASTPAEKLAVHDVATGRSQDLIQATQVAYAMVNNYGMGKNRLVSSEPQKDERIRKEAQHLVEVAEKVAAIVCKGYLEFTEDIVSEMVGTEEKPGAETMTGEAFTARLEKYIASHPEAARKVEQAVLRLMVKEGVLTEGYKKNWLTGEVTLVAPVVHPHKPGLAGGNK